MNKNVEADIEALAEEVKQLRGAIDKIVTLLGQTARDGGDEAVRLARERGERAWTEARGAADDLVHRIEEKPVASAFASFGIGFLVGILFARR